MNVFNNELNEKYKQLFQTISSYSKDSIDLDGICNENKDDLNSKEEKMIVLSNALKINTELKEITLRKSFINDKSVFHLSNSLSFLTWIDFSFNFIGDVGMKHLSSALKKNSSLKKINLSNNKIGDEGMKYLADSMKLNSSIDWIHITQNDIGNDGIKYFSDALKVNRTLKEVDLGYNKIGEKNIKTISELIEKNFVVHTSNKNFERGPEYLLDSLYFNNTLTKIFLEGNSVDQKVKNKIYSLVEENENNPTKSKKRVEEILKKSKLIKFSPIVLVTFCFFFQSKK